MAMLTLGTGIGGGVVLNGGLWRGRHENAGELGHKIVVPEGRACKCGQRGCLEAYASASTTAKRAEELVAAGRKSSLGDVVARGEKLTSKHVCAAARAGDVLAREVWDETCKLLAVACVNLQHTLNLERIILAGGMSAAGDDLLRPVREHFERQMWADIGDRPEIVLAEMGNDAGFVGAAYLAMKHVGVTVGAASGGR
jgi:glucokinase